MIVKGIKNFFVNLKHIFTPLGVFAIFIVIGLSVMIPGIVDAVRTLAEKVSEISGNTSIDFNVLQEDIIAAVKALDWSKPSAAVATMMSGGWLKDTFIKCINSLVADGETTATQITAAVDAAIADIGAAFIAFVIMAVLGIVLGYVLTKFLVRRNMAKRGLWKFILATVVDSVLSVLLIMLTVWIEAISTVSGIFAGLLSMIILGMLSLLEAYLVHGYKKVPLKRVVNIKNILRLFLASIIIIMITFVLVLIILSVANIIVGLFICLPLVEIAILVLSLNSEAYVKDLVAESEQQ